MAHARIVPFYYEAYSSEDPSYPGSTEKIIEIVQKVKTEIGTKGTWAIDRQVKAQRIHNNLETPHKAHIYVPGDRKKGFIHLEYGATQVSLPESPDIWYTLVAIK